MVLGVLLDFLIGDGYVCLGVWTGAAWWGFGFSALVLFWVLCGWVVDLPGFVISVWCWYNIRFWFAGFLIVLVVLGVVVMFALCCVVVCLCGGLVGVMGRWLVGYVCGLVAIWRA